MKRMNNAKFILSNAQTICIKNGTEAEFPSDLFVLSGYVAKRVGKKISAMNLVNLLVEVLGDIFVGEKENIPKSLLESRGAVIENAQLFPALIVEIVDKEDTAFAAEFSMYCKRFLNYELVDNKKK